MLLITAGRQIGKPMWIRRRFRVLPIARHKPNRPGRTIRDLVGEPKRVVTRIEAGVRVHPTGDGELWSGVNFQRVDIKNRPIPWRELLFRKYPTDFCYDISPQSRQSHV